MHWFFDGVTVRDAQGEPSFGEPTTPADLADVGGVWLGMQIAADMARQIGVTPATIAAGGVS